MPCTVKDAWFVLSIRAQVQTVTGTYFTLTECLAPGHLMQQEIIYFVICMSSLFLCVWKWNQQRKISSRTLNFVGTICNILRCSVTQQGEWKVSASVIIVSWQTRNTINFCKPISSISLSSFLKLIFNTSEVYSVLPQLSLSTFTSLYPEENTWKEGLGRD